MANCHAHTNGYEQQASFSTSQAIVNDHNIIAAIKSEIVSNISSTLLTCRKLGQKILFHDMVVQSILYHRMPLVLILQDLVGNKFVPAKQLQSLYSEYLPFASNYNHECYINTKSKYMAVVL